MNEKEKNFVSAVIYIYNAEDRIGKFLETIVRVMEGNFEHSEIICVNDYSSDNSISVVKDISEKVTNTNVTVVNMSYFHGLELAMNAGVDLAIGDFVFEFDNTRLDFSDDVVMQVYNRSLEGYDIVSASANKKDKFTSRMFYNIFDRFADQSYKMATESFRILSRRVINRISSMNKTIPYRKAVYANSGLRTDSIKYAISNTEYSVNDKREKSYWKNLAIDSLLLFTEFGYKFSMSMTFAMMFISIFMVLYSIITYIVYHPVEGWTTTILFLSFAFFGLFAILTIIIKYLQLIVNVVYKRKHYSFESVEKLTNK